jgi:hypothetical protein
MDNDNMDPDLHRNGVIIVTVLFFAVATCIWGLAYSIGVGLFL